MALIEVKGYVNKPATRGTDKKFATFTLAERQLHGKEKKPVKVYYDVTNWETSEPPKESAFVTVKGYLNVETVEKDGKRYVNHRINAQSIDIIGEPTNDVGNKDGAGKVDVSQDDFSDLNF